MTKKPKTKKAVTRDESLTMLRVAEVITKNGTFYRLIYLTTTAGAVTEWNYAHDWYQDQQDIIARAQQLASAIQLPVIEMRALGKPN